MEEPGSWATVHGVAKSPTQLSMDMHAHAPGNFSRRFLLGFWVVYIEIVSIPKSLPNANKYTNTATFNSDVGVGI